MQTLLIIGGATAALCLAVGVWLYVRQRRLIFFPVAHDHGFAADPVSLDSEGVRLHGWLLNPGSDRALVYFGGNSEMVTHRREFFEDVFRDYSVYLFNYRGYGLNQGSPSEAALCADALAIYDWLNERHASILACGRSLGSGVAVYLAAHRPLEQLLLLTPYDSLAEVAQRLYPVFPARWLLKDRFDSAALADRIEIPVMIASTEHDREIPPAHALALTGRFTRAPVRYVEIAGAAHDDVVDFPAYRDVVREFVA